MSRVENVIHLESSHDQLVVDSHVVVSRSDSTEVTRRDLLPSGCTHEVYPSASTGTDSKNFMKSYCL